LLKRTIDPLLCVGWYQWLDDLSGSILKGIIVHGESPVPSLSPSHTYQLPHLDQAVKMPFNLSWQLPARHEQAQLHVDCEGILGEVGARQEEPVSIGYRTFDMQD